MTQEEKLERAIKLADAMYYSAQQLSTDASHLKGAMEDWWHFKNVELKESEDEKIREYLIRYIDNTMKSSELKSKLLAWLEKQGEHKPQRMISAEAKESLLHDKYEGLTDFERTLADICIGWIGQELGWKQYIKDNADVLLKVAVEKFNSVQDVPFEQKPAWNEDESIISDLLDYFDEDKCLKHEVNDIVKWLKTIKPQQKGWSDNEIKMFDNLITYLDGRKGLLEEIKRTYIDWLKSIKSRVKPKQEWSEEDQNALEDVREAIVHYWGGDSQDILLYWLKSIKQKIKGE